MQFSDRLDPVAMIKHVKHVRETERQGDIAEHMLETRKDSNIRCLGDLNS